MNNANRKKILIGICVLLVDYGMPIYGVTIQGTSRVGGSPLKRTLATTSSSNQSSDAAPTDNSSDDQSADGTSPAQPVPANSTPPAPIIIKQTPTIAANVYLVNALPVSLTISYAQQGTLPSKSFTTGPATIQPGQAINILSCNVKSTLEASKEYQFNTTVNGSIPYQKNQLQLTLMQRIINTGNETHFEYALQGNTPAFSPEWTSQEREKTYSGAVGQATIFLDYLAHEGANGTNVCYCIAPKSVTLSSSTLRSIGGKDFEKMNDLAPRIWSDMFSSSASALKPLSAWAIPRPELRYDQSSFLGTHQSFANQGAGFLYNKQVWQIRKQLDMGVRVIELDLFPNPSSGGILCLGSCADSQYLHPGKTHTVIEVLGIIKSWLDIDTNQQEIITIILNNKLPADATFRLFDQAGLVPLTLTRELWEPVNRSNLWPRIGWLQLYKKRVIVFDRSDVDCMRYGYPAKQYLVRNTPGTFDITQAAKQSPPVVKPIPHLFECCYYGSIDAPLALHNTPEQLKKLLAAIKQNNYLNPNQVPNFIMLDHVEMGNPMALVNEINKATQP